jgi:signal transduction histidine kinase
MRSTRRLVLVFALAILAPGLILGGFGVHALIQERRHAEQQVIERLAVEAERVGRRLQSELSLWQQAAEDIARSGTPDPAQWPERVRKVTARPGGALVLLGARDRPRPVPPGQLLWEISPQKAFTGKVHEPSPLLIRAESLELRDKRYVAAIALYREALAGAATQDRPMILHRLARTLAKAGRPDEALKLYEHLAAEPPVLIGSLPSDLVARYAVAQATEGPLRAEKAAALYRSLIDGQWLLSHASYAHYSETVREWTRQDDITRELGSIEEEKIALTRAAEAFLAEPTRLQIGDANLTMAFWSPEPGAAIILGPRVIRDELLDALNTSDVAVSVAAPDGRLIAGIRTPAAVVSADYPVDAGGVPLRLQAWPKDPKRFSAGAERQRTLYVGSLAIVLALLTFGGYFTFRTLKSELAVAQMKADFVSTVSHEFRSPLTGINQLAEMLRDGRLEDDARRRQYYGMIVTETHRLRRLVENVLDFSRMENGRKQYRFESLEPSVWLRELTEGFGAQVAAAGFSIETHIPPDLPAILADRETLTTAVNNLLDNAAKYSLHVKNIRVQAESEEQGLRISVRDSGVGIREADRAHIFEKFYRGGGELSRQVKGVGLGLNLVRHIVSAHGGFVEFESKEGEGSTFTIRLNHGAHSAG